MLELALVEVDALCAEGRIGAALARAEAALAAGGAPEGPALARLRTIRVRLLQLARQKARAADVTAAAVAATEPAGGAALAHALADRALARQRTDGGAGARADLERALAVARACADAGAVRRVAVELAHVATLSGDATAARAAIGEAESHAGPDGDTGLHLIRAVVLANSGDLDAADAAAQRALDAARWPSDRGDVLTVLAHVARLRRDPKGSLAYLDAALAAYGALDLPVHHALEACVNRGELQRATGDWEGARASYLHARDGFAPGSYGFQACELNLALVEVGLGRLDEARRIAPPLDATRRLNMDARLTRELLDAVLAADAGRLAAFDAAFRPFIAGGTPGGFVLEDLAFLAARASELAERRRTADWLVRAVRARRLALDQALRLGRASEARGHTRALRRLQDRGAPVPLRAFLLHRRIGKGLQGEVWEASHPSGARLAVKVLGDRDDLDHELRAVAGLEHPNVVQLLDAGVVEPAAVAMAGFPSGARWIATELAETTAGHHLGRLSFGEVHGLLLDLLDALALAHARGLLHLDVKPANVLLVPGLDRPVAKLADFGLAAALGGPATEAGTGTVPYMAPELLEEPVRTGPQTDLYALGCTAFELVAGRPPFVEPTAEEVKQAHRTRPPPLDALDGAPAGLRAWVARLLEKRPEDRFATAPEAARALAPLGPERSPAPSGVRAEILEAGLGLFPLRVPPLVGRGPELEALEAALAEVGRTGVGRTVVVRGPRGVGATSLVRAFAERAAVRGEPVPIAIEGPGPGLVLVTARPEDPLPPDAEVLDLGPPPDPAAVLRARLPLAPGLAERLAAATGGSPRLGVALLAELVARDALVPGAEGYVLRSDEILLPDPAGALRGSDG